uniref:Uncharacterized protein n=1 Tax=Avena sativa TaxID=4498 RepID=A0ACD5WC78_AVESA
MLRKSSSQKTLRDVMQEESTGSMASRLLASDASLSNPSFRNYYGVAAAGSVPFLWESAPGTPKTGISSAELPPLTPPPSYYSKPKSSKKVLPSPKPAGFVPKMFRRSYTMPSPSASSSKESVPAQCSRRKRLVVMDSHRLSFSSTSRVEDEEGDEEEVRSTTLCFGTRHSGGGTGRLHGLLASVVRG